MSTGPRRYLHRDWIGPAVAGIAAFAAVLATIGPGGRGPGVTIDEHFNAGQGYLLTEAVRRYGVAYVHPASQLEVFRIALNDHPPWGRWWIGIGERLFRNVFAPEHLDAAYSLAAARVGPAAAFALTVFLVGWAASKWYGRTAGITAAVSLILMPRVFGHAHFASLESFIGLTYAAAILSVAHFWDRDQPPSKRVALLTGALCGVALLSKVQAIFIPIPVAIWALIRFRQRAIVPLLLWGGAGLVVFYAGWPFLWDAPVDHLMQYLGRTTKRIVLHNWYLGTQYADRETPWHYPWVMFAVTVPIGLQALGIWGVVRVRGTWRAFPREWLLLGAIALPLLVFTLPGTPVYDGVRLFLVVFPLWAVFVGRGGQLLQEFLATRISAGKSRACLGALLAAQAYGILMFAPCWLSYYNLAVGGLRGADRLGFERNYWSDSLTHELIQEALDEIPAGSTIYVAPMLHQFQLEEMLTQEPLFGEQRITLAPYAGEPPADGDYLMLFYRRANLDVQPGSGWRTIAELRRENVPLAGVYQVVREPHD